MGDKHVFLSYTLTDIVAARRVVRAVEARGWSISWERYEHPDAIAAIALREAIDAADCVAVLWSQRALEDARVIEDATRGRDRGILIQGVIDETPIPMPFVLDEPVFVKDGSSVEELVDKIGRVFLPSGRSFPPMEASALQVAESRVVSGDLEGAVAVYERWVRATPGDVKSARRLGELFLALGRNEDASGVLAAVGERYASSGLIAPAIESYRRATALGPKLSRHRKRLEALVTEQEQLTTGSRRAMSSVQFTVTAPAYVQSGDSVVVDLWAHQDRDREKVVRRQMDWAKAEAAPPQPTLTARLHIDGLEVSDPAQSLRWSRGLGIVSFEVGVREGLAPGSRNGVVSIYFLGLSIARVHFSMQVSDVTSPPEVLPSRQERYTRAVASFAPEDRAAVEARVRAFETAAPGIDVHVEPIDTLETFLETVSTRDVLYLFWSHHARASREVERDWRYALRLRGVDFIDPVPLESAEIAPLPAELSLHPGAYWKVAPDTMAAFDPLALEERVAGDPGIFF